MSDRIKVAVLVGSLRKGSYNRMVANALIARAGPELDCKLIEIGDLPLYNEDLDGDSVPPQWARLRGDIRDSQALLLVSPEYNRSVPAALKNALDVASRPPGANVWSGKPAAVVTVSIGAIGGFGSNHILRQSLMFLNMPTMAQPEAYLGHADKLFDDQGQLLQEGTGAFLDTIMQAYREWIAHFVT